MKGMWLPLEKSLNELSPAHRALFQGAGGAVGSVKIIPFRAEKFRLTEGMKALGTMAGLISAALAYTALFGWLLADGGRFAFLGGLGSLGTYLQTGLVAVLGLGAVLLLWPFFTRLSREYQNLRAFLGAQKNPQQFGFFLFPDVLLFRPRYNSIWVIPKIDVMGFEEGRRRSDTGEVSFGKVIYRPLNVNYTLEFCQYPTELNRAPSDFPLPLSEVLGILRTWKSAK